MRDVQNTDGESNQFTNYHNDYSCSLYTENSENFRVLRPSGFPYEKVRERTLYLQVLDYDRFSRNDPIGEVSIPLNKVELGQLKTFWKDLKPCSDGSVSHPLPRMFWDFDRVSRSKR